MDAIKIVFTLFVLCTTRIHTNHADCPSNTVEIVFTKHGIICATTDFVPELSHLSVDPRFVSQLIGNYPTVHRMGLPVIPQTFANPYKPAQQTPYHYQLVQQQPAQPQNKPAQLFTPEQMPIPVAMPQYQENLINQNNQIEYKRIQYQKMLWDKLRRDAHAKKLLQNSNIFNNNKLNENNVFNNNNNNNVPKVEITQKETQNVPQLQKNPYNIPLKAEETPNPLPKPTVILTEQLPDYYDSNTEESDQTEQQLNTKETIEEKPIEEPIDSDNDNHNSHKQQLLKDYLSYLKNKDKRHTDQSNNNFGNRYQSYDNFQTNNNRRVPEIIRGFMPLMPKTSDKQLNYMSTEEPSLSQSQLSYQIAIQDNIKANNRYYNQKSVQTLGFPQTIDNNKYRLVGTELSFGLKADPTAEESKRYGYGYKNELNYKEKSGQSSQLYDKQNEFIEKPIDNHIYEEDVVLVTADPQQRQLIEKFEAQEQQQSRHGLAPNVFNLKPSIDNSVEFQSSLQNSYNKLDLNHKNRNNFRLDESRIEYSGWTPIRTGRARLSSDDQLMASSTVVKSSINSTDLLPFRGRAHKWKSLNNRGF